MTTSARSSRQIIYEFEYGDHSEFGLGPSDVIPDDPQEDETQLSEGANVEAGASSTKAKSKWKLSTV